MSKIGKTMKGALVGVMGTAGIVGAGVAQAGTVPYAGDDADFSGVICDDGQGLEVEVRFDGPDDKCLEMDNFQYWNDGEWAFGSGARAYYGATDGSCNFNPDVYGWIGKVDNYSTFNLLKFEVKWTDAAKGSGKPGKPNHDPGTNNTVEISLKQLGEIPECDVL